MKHSTALPQWNDPSLKAGTMIRTALWLLSEVGVGNVFTKEKHKAAFAGVTQADRRLRDLRDYGWVFHTSIEDLTLNSEEQRFVRAGASVWESGVRRDAARRIITAKERMEVLAANDYQCAVCGVAGGESYFDAPHMTAVLSVSRRTVTTSDGQRRVMYVSECKRCSSGEGEQSLDVPGFLVNVGRLEQSDRALFASWTEGGRREPLDRVWAQFRRLPANARDEVRAQLKQEKPL